MRGVDVCEEARMAAVEVAHGAVRYNEGAGLDTKAAVRELRGRVDSPTTLTVGDRRGRVRDASNESGERDMSVDLRAVCTSKVTCGSYTELAPVEAMYCLHALRSLDRA